MASNVQIKPVPSLLMLLHASKYPDCPVSGLLLCGSSGSGDQSSDGSEMPSYIDDYLPLLHSSLNLAPILEAAFYQAEAYCEAGNKSIRGLFYAGESLPEGSAATGRSPPPNVCRIGEKIAEKYGSAYIITLNHGRISSDSKTLFSGHVLTSGGKLREIELSFPPNCSKLIVGALEAKHHRSLIDFDDHLNNVSSDFTNVQLKETLKSMLTSTTSATARAVDDQL